MNTSEDKVNDRLDLLKKLSFIGGDDAINVFSSYIPDHYNEIYTLYELLRFLNIDYNSIEFLKPQENGDSFIFLCNFESPNDLDILKNFLAEKDNNVKYKRNNPYKVYVKEQSKCTYVKFKHG